MTLTQDWQQTDPISGVLAKLESLRGNFKSVYELSITTAKSWNIDPQLKTKSPYDQKIF